MQLQLTSCRRGRRQASLDVVKAAAARLQSTGALRAEVMKVQHILDGSSEGRVKNAVERAALVAVLTALCATPAVDNAAQELAETVTEFLADFYKWVLLIAVTCASTKP